MKGTMDWLSSVLLLTLNFTCENLSGYSLLSASISGVCSENRVLSVIWWHGSDLPLRNLITGYLVD